MDARPHIKRLISSPVMPRFFSSPSVVFRTHFQLLTAPLRCFALVLLFDLITITPRCSKRGSSEGPKPMEYSSRYFCASVCGMARSSSNEKSYWMKQSRVSQSTYIIITKCCLKQTHPCTCVCSVRCFIDIFVSFIKEEVCLGESKQNDDINDGKGKHVASNHRINHCDEGSSQSDGTLWKLKINRSDFPQRF
ncbi:CLUMA_CG002997, isoform A [Clunio marinus]|uniref:CLUMA_CG002997, isoform A n=1 Tax=Clunio marinus TaxID=568069 RepID=A0A1J1HRY2_9DIPT|nr:CLUMA_CG002997, isoform A [Clunio marinus]